MQKKPQTFYIPLERRRFLKSLALISAGLTVPGYLAEDLTLTPSVTQGPYYPLATNMPLDDDNDLAFYNDNITAAAGIIIYITGRVLDSSGNPIKNALVELWHTDNAELTAAGLAPTNNLESALAASLPPGLYTALLGGVNNGTGIGLVEVYDLP